MKLPALKSAKAYVPDALGLAGWAAVVAGLWARFGWDAGVLAAGLPFALFYFWGEIRSTHSTRGGES